MPAAVIVVGAVGGVVNDWINRFAASLAVPVEAGFMLVVVGLLVAVLVVVVMWFKPRRAR